MPCMLVFRAAILTCDYIIRKGDHTVLDWNMYRVSRLFCTYHSRFNDTADPKSKALPSIDIQRVLSVTPPAGFDALQSLMAF